MRILNTRKKAIKATIDPRKLARLWRALGALLDGFHPPAGKGE